MTSPVIITVAITGSLPQKKDNPAIPITVAEQIDSTQEAFNAGASIVHVHVRDADGRSSSDPEKFLAFKEGVNEVCPGMIVQFSTGGRGRESEERGAMLRFRPDMASLCTGSVNFPNAIYENHPELVSDLAAKMLELGVKPEIEVFDLSMMYNAFDMAQVGQLNEPIHVQFVFGMKGILPPRREILEFEVAQLEKLLPGSTWTAAGIGRHQLTLNHWALEMGGHCRTGLEDNVRFDEDRLANSNAELVARVARIAVEQYNRPIATAAQARELLNLPPAP